MIEIPVAWFSVVVVFLILAWCFTCWMAFVMGSEDEFEKHAKEERDRVQSPKAEA